MRQEFSLFLTFAKINRLPFRYVISSRKKRQGIVKMKITKMKRTLNYELIYL